MPFHEFKCRVCGQYFQRQVSSVEEKPACLKCGSTDLECITCGRKPGGITGALGGRAAANSGRGKY